MFTVKTRDFLRTMTGGGVVVVEVVVITWGVVVVGVVTFISAHSGDTGVPVSLLQLMYKLELSEVKMAVIALIASWLLTAMTCLVISTMMEWGERSKKMQLVMERVSDLRTEMLWAGKWTKVEEFKEMVLTLLAVIWKMILWIILVMRRNLILTWIASSTWRPLRETCSMLLKLISRC